MFTKDFNPNLPVFEIFTINGNFIAANFKSEIEAEEKFLEDNPIEEYLGIGEIVPIELNEDGLDINLDAGCPKDRIIRNARGQFAGCRPSGGGGGGGGSVEAPKTINSKTNIAQLRAIAEKEGIKTPDKPNLRQSWIDAIEKKAGDKYKGKRGKPAGTKTTKKTEPEPEKKPIRRFLVGGFIAQPDAIATPGKTQNKLNQLQEQLDRHDFADKSFNKLISGNSNETIADKNKRFDAIAKDIKKVDPDFEKEYKKSDKYNAISEWTTKNKLEDFEINNKKKVLTNLQKVHNQIPDASPTSIKLQALPTKKTSKKPSQPKATAKSKDTDDLDNLIKNVDRSDHKQLVTIGDKLTKKHIDDSKFKNADDAEKAAINKKLEAYEKYQKLRIARDEGELVDGKKVLVKDVDNALKEMRKSDEAAQKLIYKRKEERDRMFENLRNEIKEKNNLNEEQAKSISSKLIFEESVDKNTRDVLQFYNTEFLQLTGGKGSESLKTISANSDRAYASRESNHMDAGKNVNAHTYFHEAAHHMEYEDAKLGLAANAWRNDRATSKQPQKMNDLANTNTYDDSEVAYPDKFVSPYVGKIYGSDYNGSTEVVSMGVERFLNPPSMRAFYDTDPDHFKFIVGSLVTK